MPFVEIKVWKGRTDDGQKEQLIKDMTDAVEKNVGCPREAIDVCITEVARENWGRAGNQASKLDL